VEEKVAVEVDQPGDEGETGEVDPYETGGLSERAGRADGGNPAVLDQEVEAGKEALPLGIEHPGPGQEEWRRGWEGPCSLGLRRHDAHRRQRKTEKGETEERERERTPPPPLHR
jgi:hypothetical protein